MTIKNTVIRKKRNNDKSNNYIISITQNEIQQHYRIIITIKIRSDVLHYNGSYEQERCYQWSLSSLWHIKQVIDSVWGSLVQETRAQNLFGFCKSLESMKESSQKKMI